MVPEASPKAATDAVGEARAFVTGPGDLAYVGPFLGVPTVVLHDGAATLPSPDLEVASRAARWPLAPFTVLDTRQLDLAVLVGGAHG
jgi:hypothetical protein